MGLFSKKDNKKKKSTSEPIVIEYDYINPYTVIMDVENHLQIVQKQEIPFFPTLELSNKISSPEVFKISLEDEINKEDEIVEEAVIEEIKEEKQQENIIENEIIEEEINNTTEEEQEDIKEELIEDAEIINEDIQEDSPTNENIEEPQIVEEELTLSNNNDDIEINSTDNINQNEEEALNNIENINESTDSTNDNIINDKEIHANIAEIPQEDIIQNTKIEEESKSTVMISGLTAKKRGKLASIQQVKSGGIAVAIAEAEKQKEKEEAKRRQEQLVKAAAIRAEEKAAEMARLANVILIGKTKKPDPTLGKFEIQKTEEPLKPYKFVLKSDTGKVLFETAALRTKPNELTALMFKDVIEKGSFVFLKSLQGYSFKMLDARKKEFCSSHQYKSLLDAQKAAALIKKFGLSANYIDDISK